MRYKLKIVFYMIEITKPRYAKVQRFKMKMK